MKFPYKNILLTGLLIWLFAPPTIAGVGDNDSKVSKTISERYLMPKNGHLDIINKYGQVLISNSDNDSVVVIIEIIAYGKDRSAANKIIERVDFNFSQTNQYLNLETVLDRKSGVFKELWNSIGDYSKTLLSKNKLEINYEVSVPRSTTISINNKFGDVFMADRYKKVELELSHGNLRANDFNTDANISVSYGKAQIRHLKSGNLIFKATEVSIKSVGTVDIKSSSSELVIIKAEEVSLNSRSDKKVEINSIARLKGKMTFSKLQIENLTKSLDVDLSYTDILISHIPFNFSLVRIASKSSDIELEFDPITYMDVNIKAHEYRLDIPMEQLEKEYLDKKRGHAQYSGTIGKKNNYKGSLNIDSQHGPINIRLKPQQQSVKSK